MKYALQLYSVRDFVEYDMDYTFSRLQEFGYSGVEFCSYYGYTAEEVKAMLEKYNFSVLGVHVGLKQLEDTFDDCIKFNRHIGNENIVIAGADMYDAEHLRDAIDRINALKPKVEAQGMTLHYHTHDFDHKKNKITGVAPFDVFVEECDVDLELDTYWELIGGADPVEQMKRFKHRCKLIHVKDGDSDKKPKALGEGIAPVDRVVEYALANGLPIIVESEGCVPDGISEVKRCYKYLRKYAQEHNV